MNPQFSQVAAVVHAANKRIDLLATKHTRKNRSSLHARGDGTELRLYDAARAPARRRALSPSAAYLPRLLRLLKRGGPNPPKSHFFFGREKISS